MLQMNFKKNGEYFEEYSELIKDKKVKYIYEIIIESLLFYCLNFNEKGKKKPLLNLKEFFMKQKKKKHIYYAIKNLILKYWMKMEKN